MRNTLYKRLEEYKDKEVIAIITTVVVPKPVAPSRGPSKNMGKETQGPPPAPKRKDTQLEALLNPLVNQGRKRTKIIANLSFPRIWVLSTVLAMASPF